MDYKLFVFPGLVRRVDEDEHLFVDIENGRISVMLNDDTKVIEMESMRPYSSACILWNSITKRLYTLYNFRELLECLDMTPSGMMCSLQQRCFIQVDRYEDFCFIKAFTLDGEMYLHSHINDFRELQHYTRADIHPLDKELSWKVDVLEKDIADGKLKVKLNLWRSGYYHAAIFCSHGGKSIELKDGFNDAVFPLVATENLYFGKPGTHYVGRSVKI